MENKDIENVFLNNLLALPDATAITRACASIVLEQDFTSAANAGTWKLIKLTAEETTVNMVNVFATAKAKGVKFDLSAYVCDVYATGDLVLMAATIHEGGVKRRLSGAISDVLLDLEDPKVTSLDVCKTLTDAMAEAERSSARTLTAWPELYKMVLKRIEAVANGLTPSGVLTGYKLIDNEGGLGEGDLVIIAGRTSNGKTAFALNVALNVASQAIPVAVYSLEMTNEQVGARLLANMSGVSQRDIKSGQLNAEQWSQVVSVNDGLPIYFDDTRATDKTAIFNAIRNIVDMRGARVIVVDYLQLIRGGRGDLRVEIGKIANELKTLAVQLKISILLLSQLSRETRGSSPMPRLVELKESGEIENAADAVYLVYRPEQHGADIAFPNLSYNWSDYSTTGNALLICAKNRNGQCSEQLLGFDGLTSRFFEREQYAQAASATNDDKLKWSL